MPRTSKQLQLRIAETWPTSGTNFVSAKPKLPNRSDNSRQDNGNMGCSSHRRFRLTYVQLARLKRFQSYRRREATSRTRTVHPIYERWHNGSRDQDTSTNAQRDELISDQWLGKYIQRQTTAFRALPSPPPDPACPRRPISQPESKSAPGAVPYHLEIVRALLTFGQPPQPLKPQTRERLRLVVCF
ncbi:hypothetical protein G7K_3970-t1 [Saitoella complicata NRRL Y-17804]|uniref:Uncharacterized protein n=1 Tax=Saitoella complicata (strain BCRC 22490 / CBS 7301 / JCM 7358 / NBRC 10748 / NRRL Y-17804) TaxID=698492 RepID=A0A0E9NIY3_SAICN|nr:hypothetical protein G7K_3970-t1 [Saitoella complicata NRRL Y-17804]